MPSQKPVASNEIEYINAAQSGSMKSSLKPVTISEIIVWTSGAKSACTRSIRYFLDPISFSLSLSLFLLLFFLRHICLIADEETYYLVVFFGDDFTGVLLWTSSTRVQNEDDYIFFFPFLNHVDPRIRWDIESIETA